MLYDLRFVCRKISKLLLDVCAKICLSLCAESAVQICSTAALECVPSCCLLLLPAQKSLLLSCSPSPNLLMKEWMTFSSFSSFNITPSDFWVIQVTFGWSLNPMAEIDLDQWLRLNAHLNLTFYLFIHSTLIKTHLVIYFQSHFSFLIFHWLYKSHFKIRLNNFIT